MVMYSAYMVLVVSFVLVIVLHAWFVRRLNHARERAHAVKDDYNRLRKEVAEAAETVDELDRGKDSNGTTLQTLKREIEEIREKIRTFLEEHPELKQEFGAPDKAIIVEMDKEEPEKDESVEAGGEEDRATEATGTAGDAIPKD